MKARTSALTWTQLGTEASVYVTGVVPRVVTFTSVTGVAQMNSSPSWLKARICAAPSVLNEPIRRFFV